LTAEKENTWGEFPGYYQDESFQKLWRTHSDRVNIALLIRWQPVNQTEILLKTDLFDEAVSDGLSSLLNSLSKRIYYIDTSFEVHQMAKRRHPNLQTIGADVRQLPFADGTFDSIISNSTLDHFATQNDIVTSLQECYRVLRPGGQLILTLDNLANPIVLLRNGLPFRLLYRMKIIPYYVGVTLGPYRLQHFLKEAGLKVLEVDAIMHCPRAVAVAIARCLENHASPKTQKAFLRFLMVFEHLFRLPTRFLTGHFIAVKATKS
jgi:ubiquinone/menaquinone biosynthesis C-methylase UbiE